MSSGIEVVGVDENGWQVNALGQKINNPIEKVKQMMDAKGASQKDQIRQGETALTRLAEVQGHLLKLSSKIDNVLERVEMTETEGKKLRSDMKTLRDVVEGLTERFPE